MCSGASSGCVAAEWYVVICCLMLFALSVVFGCDYEGSIGVRFDAVAGAETSWSLVLGSAVRFTSVYWSGWCVSCT